MKKNQERGNIIFFIGVLIFAVAFIVGMFTEVSAVIIDLVMGLGLIVEFIGICICYKKDKNEGETEKSAEVKALKEEKEKIEEEKTEDIVEVVHEEKEEIKSKKKNTSNKTKNNTSSKKGNSSKKGSTKKKKTTKKSTGKKTTK